MPDPGDRCQQGIPGPASGTRPTQEVAVDFDPIWATAWTALQQQGATAEQEDDCRTAFIESFYTLTPAT